MRPMTVREALAIERDRDVAQHFRPSDWTQAGRILEALVELREAIVAMNCAGEDSDSAYSKWLSAERKLAALERGEEPQA